MKSFFKRFFKVQIYIFNAFLLTYADASVILIFFRLDNAIYGILNGLFEFQRECDSKNSQMLILQNLVALIELLAIH